MCLCVKKENLKLNHVIIYALLDARQRKKRNKKKRKISGAVFFNGQQRTAAETNPNAHIHSRSIRSKNGEKSFYVKDLRCV